MKNTFFRLFFILALVFSLTEMVVLMSNQHTGAKFSAVIALSSWLSHNFFNDEDEFLPNFIKKNDYFVKKKVLYWSKRIDLYDIESEYQLPKGLLHAVMHQESGGNLHAVSVAGAVGPFQFMGPTAKDFKLIAYGRDHRTDPQRSAIAAAQYYQKLLKMFNGNLTYAIAAYNAGEGRVMRSKGRITQLPEETQNYIKRVKSVMRLYKN